MGDNEQQQGLLNICHIIRHVTVYSKAVHSYYDENENVHRAIWQNMSCFVNKTVKQLTTGKIIATLPQLLEAPVPIETVLKCTLGTVHAH